MISMAVVNRVQTACLFSRCSPRLASGALQFFSTDSPSSSRSTTSKTVSLSKILSQNTSLSRRELERLIGRGEVTLRGQVVNTSLISISDWKDINKSDVKIKVQGKPVLIDSKKSESESTPRVWAVHKLPGEVVGEKDPQDRPSMIDRISRGGVGKEHRDHLKPIGRLDIPTEGLVLVTNDGGFARQMELPRNQIHRVYRARVHGRLNSNKLDRIRQGFDGYKSMAVAVEKRHKKTKLSANTWVQITSTEGQNRQIRNVFVSLGLTVTRLIRVAYGDYRLDTIPAGMAIPVPWKPIEKQKAQGSLRPKRPKPERKKTTSEGPVRWVKGFQSRQ